MDNEVQILPIKGLLPYTIGETNFYPPDKFQVEHFFRQLERDHFIVLTGNSGIGKTSFVNCIFNDAIKSIGNPKDEWIIVQIRPGLNPIKSIAFYLSNSNFSEHKLTNGFVEEITDLLINNSNGLTELFARYPVKEGAKLLLVIDPVDDLFLLSNVIQGTDKLAIEEHIDAFINLFCTFENYCKKTPIYTVLSFSNRFPEKAGSYPKFLDLIEKNKFEYQGISVDLVEDVVDHILPDSIKKASDYDSFKSIVKADVEEEFSKTKEWLFFLQQALQQVLSNWLASRDKQLKEYKDKWTLKNPTLLWNDSLEAEWDTKRDDSLTISYKEIGGVKSSFENQAELIFTEFVKKTVPKYSRIYEVCIRSLINEKGQFIPTKYENIVARFSMLFSTDQEYLRKDCVNPFIYEMSEHGLGFFEIVRSMEEVDRSLVLLNDNYISDGDVISIRNSCLVSRWHRLEIFQKSKIKLINEYEWYSRIAYDKKNSGKADYPTTLQAYALADEKRDKTNDPEEFQIIDELFYLNDSWAKATFENLGIGFATVKDTQQYIRDGIKYWRDKAEEEKQLQLKNEKRLKFKTRIITVTLLILCLVVFPFYRIMMIKFDNMKSQFDCMVAENQRIISYIDGLQIQKLREHALQDNVPHTRIDSLKRFSESQTEQLKVNGDSVLLYSYELYNLNEFSFLFKYNFWTNRRNRLIKKDSTLFVSIFQKVLRSHVIIPEDTLVHKQEMLMSSNYSKSLNPNFIQDYSDKIQYKKPLKYSECTYIEEDTIKKIDFPYFLMCEKCESASMSSFFDIKFK